MSDTNQPDSNEQNNLLDKKVGIVMKLLNQQPADGYPPAKLIEDRAKQLFPSERNRPLVRDIVRALFEGDTDHSLYSKLSSYPQDLFVAVSQQLEAMVTPWQSRMATSGGNTAREL